MIGVRYVLVTAACNEERFISGTLDSVVSQTIRPIAWAIVSDASTDRTDEIVRAYADEYELIRLIRLDGDHPRNFAAQVNAINTGWRCLQHLDFEFIGNLDADVTFSPNYFGEVLQHFATNPRLGLTGGRVEDEGTQKRDMQEDLESVPHTTQMFRRECFEQINGYLPLPYGGADTYACVAARMHGWDVRLLPELIMHHHRLTSSADGLLAGRFRQGKMDFSLGYHPAFEVARCARRVLQQPVGVGSLFRVAGFATGYLKGNKPAVPPEYVRCSRREQMSKLWRFLEGRGMESAGDSLIHSR